MSSSPFKLAPLAIACSVLACGAPGTRPHDMSTAEHEESADREDRAAATHASGGEESSVSAGSCGSSASAAIVGGPCWATDDHPGVDRDAAMQEHRNLAAAHRAAAVDLREAEARACVGVSDDDRDMSPFDHRMDIAGTAALYEEGTTRRLVGATILFRAVRGLTADWLERVVDCHLARNASLGHDVPEMASCPLVPAGVTASVRAVGGAFAVDVRAEGEEAAREVLRRAELLSES